MLFCPFVGDGCPRRVLREKNIRLHLPTKTCENVSLSKQKKAAFGHRQVGTAFNFSLSQDQWRFLGCRQLLSRFVPAASASFGVCDFPDGFLNPVVFGVYLVVDCSFASTAPCFGEKWRHAPQQDGRASKNKDTGDTVLGVCPPSCPAGSLFAVRRTCTENRVLHCGERCRTTKRWTDARRKNGKNTGTYPYGPHPPRTHTK